MRTGNTDVTARTRTNTSYTLATGTVWDNKIDRLWGVFAVILLSRYLNAKEFRTAGKYARLVEDTVRETLTGTSFRKNSKFFFFLSRLG